MSNVNWSDAEKSLAREMGMQGAHLEEIAAALPGRTVHSVSGFLSRSGIKLIQARRASPPLTLGVDAPKATAVQSGVMMASPVQISPNKLAAQIQAKLQQQRSSKFPIIDLCDAFDVPPKLIHEALEVLKDAGSLVTFRDGVVFLGEMESGGHVYIDPRRLGETVIRFGIASDKHMGSRYSRLDVLHALYDIFEAEGITTVYDAGNWIDGEARFNKQELDYHGKPNQLANWAKHHPAREGITTYFIAGEDHEGWYTRSDGADIGREAQWVAEREYGREDLKYIGFMETDIRIPALAEGCHTSIRVVHPGGGSAYAISYTSQKLIESLSGGEKPQIMIIGHYHKAEYLHYRNIHSVQAGCVCDQSPFMRKKRLSAHVGGWIIEATQAHDGSISRFKSEWIPFFDREYYQRPWEYKMHSQEFRSDQVD